MGFDLMPVWFWFVIFGSLVHCLQFTLTKQQQETATKNIHMRTARIVTDAESTQIRVETKDQKIGKIMNNNENRSFHLISIDNERRRVFSWRICYVYRSEWNG